eukprot:GEMP01061005.1.p1 GENE.GEMP01061005.1~~GEMP01061005.1.p1  ORF type:complete len:303 (+),score=38.31 GEMP01061005.1:148-1056(+)
MGGVFSRTEISIKGHTGPVIAGGFCEDLKVVSAGYGLLIHRWKNDHRPERISSQEVESLSISADGFYVAVGLRGGEVSIVDSRTKALLCTWLAHDDSPKVAFLPGVGGLRFLLTASKCEARCWSLDRRQLPAEPQRLISVWETMDCQSMALPDSTKNSDTFFAALGSSSGVISLHQVPEGNIERLLHAHIGGVFSLAFSPCGRWLASGGQDCDIKIFRRGSWVLQHTLRGHENWILDCAFSPDGDRICSCGDKTLRLWNVQTEVLEAQFEHTDYIICCDWHPKEKVVMAGTKDAMIRIFRLK